MALFSDMMDEKYDLMTEIDMLRNALDEIHGQLGACIAQRAKSDDPIIFEHIEAAHKIASQALSG